MSDHEEVGVEVDLNGDTDGKSEGKSAEVQHKPAAEAGASKEDTMDVTDEEKSEPSKAPDHDQAATDQSATAQAAGEDVLEDEDEEFGKKKVLFSPPRQRLACARHNTAGVL
jgi:hypothetical protein